MKKTMIILALCVLIAGMPAISSMSIPKFSNLNRTLPISEKISLNQDDVPPWADGTVNGTWGLREFFLFNMREIPIGNITGYYGKLLGPIYVFAGKFYPRWNLKQTTNISGIFFGPVVFGVIGDINLTFEDIGELYDIKTNETNYVGIGINEETVFDWRIMGVSGPAFFIKGNFTEF